MAKFGLVKVLALSVAALCALGAVAAAQTTTTTPVPLTPEQEAILNDAKVREAVAKAQQAENAARQGPPDIGIDGSVTVKTAGQVEGPALSAASIIEAARCIASRFRTTTPRAATTPPSRDRTSSATRACPYGDNSPLSSVQRATHVYVVTGQTPFDVSAAQAFLVRVTALDGVYERANEAYCDSDLKYDCSARLAPESIRTAIEWLGLLRSTYEFGSISVTGQDSEMLATAVIGELIALPRNTTLRVRNVRPASTQDALQAVETSLARLTAQYLTTVARLSTVKSDIERIRKQHGDNPTIPQQQAISRELRKYLMAESVLQTYVTQYDALMRDLFVGSATTQPTFGATVQAFTLRDQVNVLAPADVIAGRATPVEQGVILWVNLNNVAGGYYSQNNIWTWVGVNPMNYSGGSVVSYRATLLESGDYVDAGVLPMLTENVNAGAVRSRVRRAHEGDEEFRRSRRHK